MMTLQYKLSPDTPIMEETLKCKVSKRSDTTVAFGYFKWEETSIQC